MIKELTKSSGGWLDRPKVRRGVAAIFITLILFLASRSYWIFFQETLALSEFHRAHESAVQLFPWLSNLIEHERYGIAGVKGAYLYSINYIPSLLLGACYAVVDVKGMRRVIGKAKANRETLWARTAFVWFYVILIYIFPFCLDPPITGGGFFSLIFLNSVMSPILSIVIPSLTGLFTVYSTVFLAYLIFGRVR